MSHGEARDARGSSARRTRSSSREASRAAVGPPVGKSVSMRVEPRPHDPRDPRRAVGDRRRALRAGSAARAESSPRESCRRPGCAPHQHPTRPLRLCPSSRSCQRCSSLAQTRRTPHGRSRGNCVRLWGGRMRTRAAVRTDPRRAEDVRRIQPCPARKAYEPALGRRRFCVCARSMRRSRSWCIVSSCF
jgi:hypothetical protein